MHSKDIQEMREHAKLYKNELMKVLFEPSVDQYSIHQAGGQTIAVDQPTIKDIPKHNNIIGIGYGTKMTQGEIIEDQEAILIYVKSKMARKQLPHKELVPPSVNGLPTDVVVVGEIRSYRPVLCGGSVGHIKTTAGTLGCIVENGLGKRFILSNNHVLANSNLAQRGDEIMEPGPGDGGDSPIATLSDFEQINFQHHVNYYDAAIAELIDPNDVIPEITTIGKISSNTKLGELYMSVRKRGRTTRHTVGVISDISADINVRFDNQLASFEDQLSIIGVQGLFSEPGDSGFLIVDAVSKEGLALLFAGGGGNTFANPIDQILDRFNVRITS